MGIYLFIEPAEEQMAEVALSVVCLVVGECRLVLCDYREKIDSSQFDGLCQMLLG